MNFKIVLAILVMSFFSNVVNAQSVSITSSVSFPVCAGTNVIFTATTSGISSPTYQWYKNNVAITGATSSTYSTTTLSNNDIISASATPASVSATTVTSSLIANLDAGNISSYNGSGNTWTDLTGNGNNVTLTNTGYSSVNGGGIALNTNGYGTQTLSSSPFNGDFTWSTIFRYNEGIWWDWIYNVGGYNGLVLAVTGKPVLSWGGWLNNKINAGAEATLINDNYYMLTFVRSGNSISCYLQASPYGIGINVSGNISLVSPLIGKGPGGEAWPNGIVNLILLYNRALTQSEITQNYNTYGSRFGFSAAAISSNSITTTITGSIPNITLTGDGCVNKTSLSTPSGQTAYAWYKDDVVISGATSNTFTPILSGSYKVQVTSGSCSTTSTPTTIFTCGNDAFGKMVALTNASSIISLEGGANFGTGKDITGKIVNATNFTTTSGTIGSTTAVLGGVISTTNAVTSSIGIMYSTDANFGTYSSTTIQSNVVAGTYTSNITGLANSTNYFAKSFIVNKAGTSYGSVINFTTTSPPISMNSNSAVSNIGPNIASISGSIASTGGSAILASGICYSSSNQTPTINDSKTTDGTSSGSYVSSVTGLTQGTTYYARAYATNSQGTEYGNQVSFTTIPTVTSPYTNRIWLDRNLGASQVATSVNDNASYGDLYQWGRAADGGQLRTAPTTPTKLPTYTTSSTYYITTQPWTSDANWNTKTGSIWNQQPWNNTDGGVNNPCPAGTRVPSTSEWTAELNGMISAGLVTNSNTATNIATGAFSSFLKIPQAGVFENGSNSVNTSKTVFWTTDRIDTYSANEIRFWPTQGAYQNANWYSFRYSVRCIVKQ